MASIGGTTWLRRADAFERSVCVRMNRGCSWPLLRRLFVTASRLGDGIVWYTLIFALPLIYGVGAVLPAIRMAAAGALGVAVYKILKRRLMRERPFISLTGVVAGTPPLDRYSFPSGHTLHAVSFTMFAVSSFPELGWLLIPLAALIAASRVVLGLHYPTDVLAGAALGSGLAFTAMLAMPL